MGRRRPENIAKLDKEIQDYIKSLEEEVEVFSSDDTIANLYLGLQSQLDQISAIFLTFKITVDDFTNKDDKGSDRYFNYLVKSKILAENLKYIKDMLTPDTIEEAKIRKDAYLENWLKEHPE